MRHMKTLCLAILVIAAVGVVTAASASASLPSPLFAEATEGTLSGSSTTAKTEFFGIVNLKGEGWSFSFPGKNMESGGTPTIKFTGVKLGSTSCSSTGASSGEVVVPSTYNIVLGTSGELLLLVNVTEFPITCGTTKIKIRGHTLSSASPFGSVVNAGEQFTGTTLCSSGAPEFSQYVNDEGGTVSVKLESNAGLGWQKSCELIEGKTNLTASASVEIMEP